MSRRVSSRLRELDDVLTGLRRVWLHPARRRRFLAELGEPVELALLRTLRAVEVAGGDEPGVGDVAAGLAVDMSTASRLVEQAVAAGYATREASPHDRRRAVVRLTAEGARLMARATEVRERLLSEVTSGWAEEDVDTLVALLARLQRDFERLDS